MKMAKKSVKFVVCVLAIGLFAGVAQADIVTDLVGHWKLDEGSGTIAVDSTGNNDGTLVTDPNPQFIAGGKIGGAIDFAGRTGTEVEDSHVNVGDGGVLDITGDRTLSAWVKIQGWGDQWVGLISKGDVAGNYDLLRSGNTGNVGFYLADKDFVVGDDVVDDGEWHMLTGVFDDVGMMYMYVDGQLDASGAVSAGAAGTNDQPLLFNALDDGNSGWDQERWFDGQMDDVRLYHRALSASDVLELYNVPEPTTMVLFGIGSLVLLGRRRA